MKLVKWRKGSWSIGISRRKFWTFLWFFTGSELKFRIYFFFYNFFYIFRIWLCWWFWSGGHINPAVTFGLFLARKLSLTRAIYYIVMQCLGTICGAGVVKGFENSRYNRLGGGANVVNAGYSKGDGLGAEIVSTFVLVYTIFSATDGWCQEKRPRLSCPCKSCISNLYALGNSIFFENVA